MYLRKAGINSVFYKASMNPSKKLFLIVSLLYILYTIFPLFKDLFSIPVWLPSMATVALLIILYPKAFGNSVCLWFIIYAIVLIIYVTIGRPLTVGIGTVQDSKKLLIEFAFILPSISIYSILFYLNDIDLIRKLFNWSMVILFASFVVVVPIMLQYNSIRAALLEESGESLAVMGAPSYSLMHAYTLLLPTMCYAVKAMNGRRRTVAIIGLIALCFIVYDTFVTTSLIIMLLVVMFTVIYRPKNASLSWLGAIVVFVLFYMLIKQGLLISLIDEVLPLFDGTAVEGKLVDFKDSLLIGQLTGRNIEGRQELHAISWDSFFQNPFIGGGRVGGHSSIIDRLGGMGIIAGLPFVMILVSFVKRMAKVFKTKMSRLFFLIGTIAAFTYLYQKGNWGGESWLMYLVLMPIGLLTIEDQYEN